MSRWRYLKDRIFVGAVLLTSILTLAPLFHMIATIVVNGAQVLAIYGLRFFTETPPPPISGAGGGIAPALVGSILVTLLSLPLSVSLALLAAILSTEFPRNPISRLADTFSRSFASIPTIIVSMVVYTVVVVPMGSFSALAGAVALSLISLPYAYTAFSTALRSIPHTYREAAYAVGMNRLQTVARVFIPIVKRAVVVGILITFARAMGETAALLFTAGRYRAGVSLDIRAATDAVPLMIFDFITTPFKVYHEIAWGATLVLLLIYLAIFIAVKTAVREVRL
ncbi:MAG: ABC transporter permease subunit [Ignisphaera sp.]|nr:ABC transporter permease subunit [Ignisphaera sp.]MDW8085844.1 ABC transporter permease subunit [Ignisphaera sp.]